MCTMFDMFRDSTRPQAIPPECDGKFKYKGKRLVSVKITGSRADLAVVTGEICFSSEMAGRSSLVRQQEIYCYHKRKTKEIRCMQSVLQEGIKPLRLPLLLLGLTLADTPDEMTASFRAFSSFGSKH